ncbi:hypothetical protein [Sphingomonas sp. NFR15]|uniref:hypothetical protein n=1 Tax=Sphingomonas sp. NFR15 TaxID=1566282 RepID=UPI000882CF29|nr:hypothetical protein [Sphingomonas sp. NFR15]SDA21595.1 hypothetical protein SAMN03159340_01466 [Sphingomonas sp. NFR15]
MSALVCTLTTAGLAALLDAAAGGTNAVRIASAGVTATAVVVAPTLTGLPDEIRLGAVAGTPIDATTIHLTVRDESAAAYTVRSIGLYLDTGTLFAVYSQPDPIVEKASVSTMFAALDVKLLEGQAGLVQFGATSFLNPPASETVKGVAYFATIAEALAGAVADKLISPATMKRCLDNYVLADRLGAPGGVATLGPDGKLQISQRPPIDLIDVWPVANEAEMLAIDGTVGDFAVRTDNGLVYVLQSVPASVLGNWLEISTPAPVSSVNGKTGAVWLSAGDVGAVPTGRQIYVIDGPLYGGGNLGGDVGIGLRVASQDDVMGGQRWDQVVTPGGLLPLIQRTDGKVDRGRRIDTGGLLTGGGALDGDRFLSVVAAGTDDIIAGLRWDLAITPAGLASLPKSLTPNGYYMWPGGFMVQWVQYRGVFTGDASVYVTFPVSFREIVLPQAGTAFIAAPNNYRDLWAQATQPSLGGTYVQLQAATSNDKRADGFDLIVFGK